MLEKVMRKLPVGIQSFEKIVEGDYLYIDKTGIALELISRHQYVFLSRPRRFGKSLFLDTLKHIFQGKKDSFQGLCIHDQYDWSQKHPVINISFAGGVLHSRESLDRRIGSILHEHRQALGLDYDELEVAQDFRNLIIHAFKKYGQKVVILIDEYDKPLLDNVSDVDIALQMQDGLRNFYSVIKENDEYLRFVFLTGVSKFSKVSVFSGLNNIEDISLDSRYATICGYTQQNIETSFKPYLHGVDLQKLKAWYNGYNFLGDEVYNPFDILLFISSGFVYRNYWFETGTPTFLLQLLKEGDYFIPQLPHLVADESLLNSFDIENLRLETVLFQAGYLTIAAQEIDADDFILYRLRLPNKEVRRSLNSLFIRYLTDDTAHVLKQRHILGALRQADMPQFQDALVALFAAIPYNNYVNNTISHYEGYYASVLYAHLASLGMEIVAEDVTSRGRIDLTLKLERFIYVLEFKVGGKNALSQIKQQGYHQKYLDDGREVYLLGINFDEDEKNISDMEWERWRET